MKNFFKIGNIKVARKKFVLPEGADPFTRASCLILGKIKPETESDFKILNEAKAIKEKGNSIDLPFN